MPAKTSYANLGIDLSLLRRVSVLLVAGSIAVGCREATLIRTAPPDAKIMVNGQFVGVSPHRYVIPRAEFREGLPIRIEREHFEPVETTLATRTAPGRIVGAIFTLGLTTLFRGPTTFVDVQTFELKRIEGSATEEPVRARETLVAPAAAPRTTVEVSPPTSASSGVAAEKLRRLQDLHDRGLISDDEYRRTRARILDGL